MKIAVSYEKTKRNVHNIFEDTKFFNFYDIVGNSVICSEIIGTMNAMDSELVHLLLMFETDALICGDLDATSRELLVNEGITVFSGCIGKADELVDLMLAGKLIPG